MIRARYEPVFRHFSKLQQSQPLGALGCQHVADPDLFFHPLASWAGPQGQPEHREFAIHLAFIQAVLSEVPASELELRASLISRAVNYLNEFAAHQRPASWAWHATPARGTGRPFYTRMGSHLGRTYLADLAQKMGLPVDNLALVSDARARSVIHAHFSVVAMDASDGDWAMLFDKLTHLARQPPEAGPGRVPILVDAQPWLAAKRIQDRACQEMDAKVIGAMHEAVEQTVRRKVAAWLASEGKAVAGPTGQAMREVELLNVLDDWLMVFVPMAFGPQQLLYLGRLLQGPSNESSDGASDGAPPTELRSIGPHTREFFCLATDHEDNQHLLGKALISSGNVPSPQQLAHHWALICAGVIEPILGALKISTDEVPVPESGEGLMYFSGLDAWLQHPVFVAFSALAARAEPGSCTAVQAGALVKLLDGLAGKHIEQAFASKGLEGLFQWVCNRLIVFMKRALAASDSMMAFLNELHLIHEELATLLAISAPYQQADFERAMNAGDAPLPKGWPSTLAPQHRIKNGGMACIQAIYEACCTQKQVASAEPVRVLTQKGLYYEVKKMLPPEAADWADSGGQPSCPADLVFCEFHHGMEFSRTAAYHCENLIEEIDGLFDRGLAGAHLSVAIDITLGLVSCSTEISEFLSHNRSRIEAGQLNVVIHRSAQKYDMLGWDNYCGGFLSVINQGASFEAFNAEMATPANDVYDLNFQGLTHLQCHAQTELAIYRSNCVQRARRLNDPHDPVGFPVRMHYEPDSHRFFQVVPNSDPQTGFVHLVCKHPWNQDSLMMKALGTKALESPNSFPLQIGRGGFGFNHTNFVNGRLSPGPWDTDEMLKAYRDHFVGWSDLLLRMNRASEAAP